MKLSFACKIGIVTTLLTVGLTSMGVYYYYSMTYRLLMDQMGETLKNVGRVGLFLFDQESRDAIKRLKVAAEQGLVVTEADLEAIPVGGTLNSLSAEEVARLESSADFLLVRKKLRMIAMASSNENDFITEFAERLQDDYQLKTPLEFIRNGMIAPYLMVETKLSPDIAIGKFLVSDGHAPAPDGWPGNPIGNLYRPDMPLKELYGRTPFIFHEIVTDDFYTSLTMSLPLIDENGQPIALLGLDYVAGKELEKLERLGRVCLGLIVGSFLLSGLVSFLASKFLNAPLRSLHDAAEKIRRHDYDVKVEVNSRDEFGLLGKAFNQMADSIHASIRTLEEKNSQLSTVVSDMHDGVGSILTSIVMGSQPETGTDVETLDDNALAPINRLARQGLAEVRYLMDALDYDDCDFSSHLDEIKMLASDILTPSGVVLDFRISGRIPAHRVPFQANHQMQRVFREAFTNIIKHSDGDRCRVEITFAESGTTILIQDNGQRFIEKPRHAGRGLVSMSTRVDRLGGSLQHRFEDGFCIQIDLPPVGA